MALPLLIGAGVALFTGFKMVGKLFGSDPDFTQAWMMNRMTGRGGFMKTFFKDGLGKMFLGSRTMSAMMFSRMGMMGGMGMMNPYMMGAMPFGGLAMGRMMWGC